MKIINIIAIILLVLSALSCTEEYEAPNSFSDFSVFTSKRTESELNVQVGDFMGFMDLSQGELSHEWVIEEGMAYMKGSFDQSDSVELFIDYTAGLVSNEKKIMVYFDSPGLKNIRLINTFPDSVGYHGSVPVGAVLDGDVWLMDTTFVVDVYDGMKPAFKVFQLIEDSDGVVIEEKEVLSVSEDDSPDISDSASWPTIDVEVGSRLKFVDMTTTDRPTGRNWVISNKPSGSVSRADSAATVFFSVYGYKTNSLGRLTSSRSGENIPGASATKQIPLKIQVVSSSKPFRFAGGLQKSGSDKITFSISGEADKMTNAEDGFTVHVVNANKGLDQDIAVSSVNAVANDATKLELTLAENIYEDDVITVSFNDEDGAIISTDERAFQSFDGEIVGISLEDNVLDDSGFFGFESYVDNAGVAYCPGYWHPRSGPWKRSEEEKFSGTASMKFNWDIADDTKNNGHVLYGWNLASGRSVPAGTYMMNVHVYIKSGSDIKNLKTDIAHGSYNWEVIMTETSWDLGVLDRDKWYTLSQPVTITRDMNNGENIRVAWHVYPADNPGVSGIQTFYFDDYELQPYDVRP